MMEELQRQSNMDLNIPEHIPEKLMTLNQLFDVHRTPLKQYGKDEDIHSQVDLLKIRRIIQEKPKSADTKQITVEDFDFYFGKFIQQKGSVKGPIFINNVEFSTEIDKIEDLIFQNGNQSFITKTS